MCCDNYTILIVEDNPNDMLFIQRAFQKTHLTHNIQIVEDGDKVVSYLSGTGKYANREQYPMPSLILLDINLPCLSGLEVLEWIQQQPQLKRVLVVMLTSSTKEEDINRAYELGAKSYLVKPVGFDNLQKMVSTFNEYWLNLNQMPEVNPTATAIPFVTPYTPILSSTCISTSQPLLKSRLLRFFLYQPLVCWRLCQRVTTAVVRYRQGRKTLRPID